MREQIRPQIVTLAPIILLISCTSTDNSDDADLIGDVDDIEVTAIDFSDQQCISQGLPIELTLKNNTNEPTVRVSWNFAVFRRGHSTNLAGADEMTAPYGNPGRVTDRIIAPGSSIDVCSTVPSIQGDYPEEELEYRVGTYLNPPKV